MRKYLMTGVAALAICAAFTSCSSKGDELYNPEQIKQNEVAKIYEDYNSAFIKTFGQPAANQDWGFGSNSRTRTAYTNSNMWESDGLGVPAAITDREREVVMEWFRTHENPRSETVDLQNYFIQNVGYTDHTYPGEGVELKDNNGHNVTITNPGRNHMDYIFVGPGAEATAWNDPTPKPYTWNEGDDHINNFNANSGEIQYIKYSGSEWFGFHDSYGTGYSTPGHGDNGKYCAVNRNFVIRYIDVDGVVGCYVGFNYESGKTSEGWHLEPDGFFDDRVIKLVPGEGSVPPPSHNYTIRVIGEDLTLNGTAEEDADLDFDFNDVVFDVAIENGETWIRLQAAGGTLPLTIDGIEVHGKFGVGTDVCVNTHAEKVGLKSASKSPVEFQISYYSDAKAIPVKVTKSIGEVELTAVQGDPASKIGVSTTFNWVDEKVSLKGQYPLFTTWVQQGNGNQLHWY